MLLIFRALIASLLVGCTGVASEEPYRLSYSREANGNYIQILFSEKPYEISITQYVNYKPGANEPVGKVVYPLYSVSNNGFAYDASAEVVGRFIKKVDEVTDNDDGFGGKSYRRYDLILEYSKSGTSTSFIGRM